MAIAALVVNVVTCCCRLKWFHVYRIQLILSHDEHGGLDLHEPNASGRYNAVSCRQALDLVFSLLYRHSSFVLIDKHTYVTLLYRSDVSFYTGLSVCRRVCVPCWSLLTHSINQSVIHSVCYSCMRIQSSNNRVSDSQLVFVG